MDLIEDSRRVFKVETFSKFKRSDVKRALITNLVESRLEPSCFWTAEMVCSGYFEELWEVIFFVLAKHVHLANPKLPLYVDHRLQQFRREASLAPEVLALRNMEMVRRLFAEIMAVLCVSPKRLGQEHVVIQKSNLSLTTLHEKMCAPDMSYLTVFEPTDPKELFVPFNEFAYALSTRRSLEAFYWLEWILLFESEKKKCTVAPRAYTPRFANDVIWVFWDIVLKQTPCSKITEAVLNMFKLQFCPTCKHRRRHLLYLAILQCCEPLDMTVEMVHDKAVVEAVTNKCNLLYKEIKKNEQSGHGRVSAP
jgi:hypothetical protein